MKLIKLRGQNCNTISPLVAQKQDEKFRKNKFIK